MRMISILIVAGVVVLVTVLSSVFIVDEREQALVLQFGQVVREIRGDRITPDSDVAEQAEDVETTAEQDENIELSKTGPGLYFKVPLIQDVVYYDDRILPLDTAALEVTPGTASVMVKTLADASPPRTWSRSESRSPEIAPK